MFKNQEKVINKTSVKSSFVNTSNLSVKFGDKIIVDGFDLTLNKGEIGCLVGSSGCGKTTVLRAIAGLEKANNGQVVLDGRVMSNEDIFVIPSKRSMGMVFQDYALFGHLTIAKNIAFGLNKLSKDDCQSRVNKMLELIKLTDYADKKPHQLSGGQQQRVALARALAPEPKLLLLDEPFSNLDVLLRESLAMNVRDILKRTETTAILVTHDQNEAFAIADKVGVMHNGKMVQWATPSQLYHEPISPFVADFIGEGSLIKGTVINQELHTVLGYTYCVHTDTIDYNKKLDYPNETVVDVLIRPDDIVHDDNSEMKALVIDRVFRGANYLYKLQLADSQVIYSLIASHHDHPLGSHIGIKANLEHVVLYTKE